jgi:hypothetical protein
MLKKKKKKNYKQKCKFQNFHQLYFYIFKKNMFYENHVLFYVGINQK